MTTPLSSLISSGTKLWLDSIDPELLATNLALGATGATSNPIIVADLIRTGRFDQQLQTLLGDAQLSDEDVAWRLTDQLVSAAEASLRGVWEASSGNNGYVSFEIDPLLDDPDAGLTHAERVEAYIELGKRWASGHPNRMIKVPATEAGLDALEALCAAGVTLNVTLLFTSRQYELARDAIWRGAQQRPDLDGFKSVYSIFVSRIDVYAAQHVPQLSPDAQGLLGIVNAQRIWQQNQDFWQDKHTPLAQEMIFASTGTKSADDPPWKYVAALAGSDIQTNPPATNAAIQQSNQRFTRQIDVLPPQPILDEIDRQVDWQHLERVLMEEGIRKFADPFKSLLALIAEARAATAA